MEKRRGWLALVAWTAVLVGGLVVGSAGEPVRGDTLVYGMISPVVLNPVLNTDVPSGTVIDTVFSGLVTLNDRLEYVPDLAHSWEVSEDGTVVTFYLRGDVLWHDGTPFTAEDVAFTLKTIMDPHTITVRRGDFEQVERWEVVDSHTFRVYFVEPFAPALSSFSIGIIPKHLLDGVDVNVAPFNTKPVGTGPFVFEEWVPDVHVIVARNESYYGQVPYLDRIVFRIIPDTVVLMEELAAGSIDISGVSPVHFQRMLGVAHLNVHRYPSRRFTYFGWNEAVPKFNDHRVRVALGLALDREVIAEVAYEGLAVPATGPFLPISWAINPEVEPLRYDPEAALALLGEVGWVDSNGDGWLDRDGETFEFTFLALAGDTVSKMIVELAMEFYSDIGVKLNPLFLEWGDFITRLDPPAREFEAFSLGFNVSADPDVYIFYHSSQAEWGFNDTAFSDAIVDELIEAGRRTLDFAARQQISWNLHQRLHELQPVTFMFFVEAILGVHQRFNGVVPSAAGTLWNVQEWWVDLGQQRY